MWTPPRTAYRAACHAARTQPEPDAEEGFKGRAAVLGQDALALLCHDTFAKFECMAVI